MKLHKMDIIIELKPYTDWNNYKPKGVTIDFEEMFLKLMNSNIFCKKTTENFRKTMHVKYQTLNLKTDIKTNIYKNCTYIR